MKKWTLLSMIAWTAVFTGTAASGHAAEPENLIKDAKFEKADFAPLAENTAWRWYQIAAPSEVKLDKAKGTVTMTGGKTFLHSALAGVTPAGKYRMGLKAEGKGKVSIESLWWSADGGMAKPHRTIPVKPVELKGEAKTLTGEDTAPEGAAMLYIRVVVEEGTITVSSPAVVTVP